MKLIFSAVESGLQKAWRKHLSDLPFVDFHDGSILDLECDAIVSPANSFGFMDGGIDLLYSEHFGWGVQEELQRLIRIKHHGELLVGSAEIVATQNKNIPYVISAPTMRVPMLAAHTPNAYLAARGALLLHKYGIFLDQTRIRDRVTSIAFPGLGTGVGQMPFEVCAIQVRLAINHVMLQTQFPSTWQEAQSWHVGICG